jgi:hypothetical protein
MPLDPEEKNAMSGGQLLFYATASDLGPLLSLLEAQKKLQYTSAGMFEANRPQTYRSYADIPRFGQPHHPNAVANPYWLISPQTTAIRVEAVPQRAGGTLFAIDQKSNEYTVAFSPGGRYEGDVLLYGEVSTIWDTMVSKDLYNFIAQPFRERFTQVQEFLVGPEALELCKTGVRLALSVSTPPEFDLKPQFGLVP